MPQFVNSLRGMWDPMRTTRPLALFLLLLSLSLTGFAQGGSPSAPLNPGPTAPIPSDPHEIATGETQVALAPSERSSVLALIERAREKSDLTFAGSAAFALDVSFDASSQTQSSAPSSGKIQETWLDPQHWQWTAQLGGYSQTRLFLDGKAYDENVTSPLPLRLQMARDAIFWPAPAAGRLLVRTTSASWDGKNVTCVLTSGGGSTDATPGRRWVESEWCIDPQSGLLQIFSLVPGLYAVYDYDSALKFQGRVLPRQITVYENGNTVLHVRLERVRAANAKDSGPMSPTEQTKANGPKNIVEEPVRLQLFGNPPPGADNSVIQPVYVHALLGPNEQVLEAETLQNPSPTLVQAAIERAKILVPNSLPPNAPNYQREVFLNLEFNPASAQTVATAGPAPLVPGRTTQPVAPAPAASPVNPARGPAIESRALTLIRPGDPDFDSMLDTNFPGLRQQNEYSAIRPLLILLRNDTSHAAVAYTIRWDVQMPDGKSRQIAQSQFIQRRYWTPQEARALEPGTVHLIFPLMGPELKPGDNYLSLPKVWSRLATGPMFSSAQGNPVTATEDAMIYDDGSYVGADASSTSLRYRASGDAAHDEAAALLQFLATNAPVGDVLVFLENEQRTYTVNTTGPPRREVLYPYYRREVAQTLENTYQQSGLQGMRNRAASLANDPRPEITRVGGSAP